MQRLKQGPRTAGVAEFTPPLCLPDNPAKRRLPYACSPLLDMPRVAVLYLFSVRQRAPWVSRRRVDLESPVLDASQRRQLSLHRGAVRPAGGFPQRKFTGT